MQSPGPSQISVLSWLDATALHTPIRLPPTPHHMNSEPPLASGRPPRRFSSCTRKVGGCPVGCPAPAGSSPHVSTAFRPAPTSTWAGGFCMLLPHSQSMCLVVEGWSPHPISRVNTWPRWNPSRPPLGFLLVPSGTRRYKDTLNWVEEGCLWLKMVQEQQSWRERERERESGGWREREKAVPMTVLILGSKILLKLH